MHIDLELRRQGLQKETGPGNKMATKQKCSLNSSCSPTHNPLELQFVLIKNNSLVSKLGHWFFRTQACKKEETGKLLNS